jgi:hypothetical protein
MAELHQTPALTNVSAAAGRAFLVHALSGPIAIGAVVGVAIVTMLTTGLSGGMDADGQIKATLSLVALVVKLALAVGLVTGLVAAWQTHERGSFNVALTVTVGSLVAAVFAGSVYATTSQALVVALTGIGAALPIASHRIAAKRTATAVVA